MQSFVGSLLLLISLISLHCGDAISGFSTWKGIASRRQDSAEQDNADSSQNIETTTTKRQIDDRSGQCRDFAYFPQSLILNSNIMTSLGHGYTAEECKQACADTTEFTCVAAMMESVGCCFISGYSLISDYFSTHYARTCAEGANCFQRKDGYSAGFTGTEAIPSFISSKSPPTIHPMYCIVQCQRRQMCVGVDYKQNPPRCFFEEIKAYRDPTFDLYVRRC